MKYLITRALKPAFRDDVIEAYDKFLEALREQGKLGLSGGFTDNSGGAYIIEAENLPAAEAVAFSNPIYTTDSSSVTVHEWNAKL